MTSLDPTSLTSTSARNQFMPHILADETLASALADTERPDIFAERLLAAAHDRGIELAERDIQNATRPDPLGIARFVPTPPDDSLWPPRHWLPIGIVSQNDAIFVDWLRFGPEPLTKPFFEQSIHATLYRPFNRMFRYRMTLEDFLQEARRQDRTGASLMPSGFIFHMSRCGSTLVSRMLAALSDHVVISEAPAVDDAVRLGSTALPDARHADILRAMILAFSRPRAGGERHAFFKLDCWHTLTLPLFEKAFPETPWLFLYRDPVEVMVSQMRERGSQTVPGFLTFADLGLAGYDVPNTDHCAQVLNRICAAAADRLAKRPHRGLAVDYRELPDAVFSRILPHFGIYIEASARDAMRRTAAFDAKLPQLEFAADSVAKHEAATPALRDITERHLGPTIRRLDALNRPDAAR
ncbi:MAG: aspartyl beta-hydroxylase [Rhodopseudomonas sp.]|nr:aspartyl beta-hydroxylase [Rhodopseudomonas sp.]